MSEMNVLSVIGTRPQYIKLAAIYAESNNLGINHHWIDTGQHYSDEISNQIVHSLEIPEPLVNLHIGSDSHSRQTGKMLEKIEDFLLKYNADYILVYGDTNSTLAGALAARKLKKPVAHIEAGLRSSNLDMPEEINRRAVDAISTFLFAPSVLAADNLRKEGHNNYIFTGDVTYDLLKKYADKSTQLFADKEEVILCTIHRAENTDNALRLQEIFTKLSGIEYQISIPAHPRLLNQLKNFNIKYDDKLIKIGTALNYQQIIDLILKSKCVITDSGGLQKEAYLLGKKCITIRNETEWPETLSGNWNVLNPSLIDLNRQINSVTTETREMYFGNGNAASSILHQMNILINGK